MGNLEILTRRRTGGAGAFTPGRGHLVQCKCKQFLCAFNHGVVLNHMKCYHLRRIHQHILLLAKSQSVGQVLSFLTNYICKGKGTPSFLKKSEVKTQCLKQIVFTSNSSVSRPSVYAVLSSLNIFHSIKSDEPQPSSHL